MRRPSLALFETVVGARTRKLHTVVVFLLLLMVNPVFGVVIAEAEGGCKVC